MERYRSKCRRCGGTLAREGDEIRCVSCGWTYFRNHERGLYYDQHRLDILNDFRTHGRKFIMQKYQIPKGTVTGLIKKWQLREDQALLDPPPLYRLRQTHHAHTIYGAIATTPTIPGRMATGSSDHVALRMGSISQRQV